MRKKDVSKEIQIFKIICLNKKSSLFCLSCIIYRFAKLRHLYIFWHRDEETIMLDGMIPLNSLCQKNRRREVSEFSTRTFLRDRGPAGVLRGWK